MGSDIIIRPTLLSIQRSCDIPLTVKTLGLHELKDRIVHSAGAIRGDTVFPNGSLALLGAGDLQLLAEKGRTEIPHIVILTSERSDVFADRRTVTVEVGASERTNEDATIFTVDLSAQIVVLVVRTLAILFVHDGLLERELNCRIQRQIGCTTDNSCLSSILGGLTNLLALTLPREHRANEIAFVCHILCSFENAS